MENSKQKKFRIINIDLTNGRKLQNWQKTKDKFGLYPDLLIFLIILHIFTFPIFLANQNSNKTPSLNFFNLQDTILEDKLITFVNN